MKKLAILLLFPSLAFAQVQVQGKPGGAIQIGGNQPGVSSIQRATGDFTFDGTGFSGCSTSGGVTTCTFTGGGGSSSLTTNGRSGLSTLAGSTFNIPANLGGNVYSLPNFSSLVGAFTDSSGNVIQPIAIGAGPVTFPVPWGATQLQLGINDPGYFDITGSWVISVNGTNYTVPGTSAPWSNTGGLNPQYPIGNSGGTSPVVAAIGSVGTPVTIQYVSGTISNGAICGGSGSGPWTAAGQPNCAPNTVSVFGNLPGFWTQTALSASSAGVSSIDSQTGAFTFGGSGVSHVGNAYTFSGGGGSGTVSGQAEGVIPLGTSATVIGAQSHLDDGVTTAGHITSSEPVDIAGTTHGVTIPAGTAVSGAAGKVVVSSDATNGYLMANENNTGASRVCTAANGICTGGGGSLPTATAAGQIVASTAAGTTYAAEPSDVYWNSGDTVASINANTLCATACVYHLTGTVNVTASASLNAAVHVLASGGGNFNVSSAQTLTFSGGFSSADLKQHFTGAGSVAFSTTTSTCSPEWFGGAGDWNGSTGTANDAALASCVSALQAGNILLQSRGYKVTGTLTINKSNVGILGTAAGYQYSGGTQIPSYIISTSASANIISVGSGALWGQFRQFALERSVQPSGTAAGMSFTNTGGFTVDQVQSNDSIRCFYFNGVGAYGVGQISNTQAAWGFTGITYTGTGSVYGYYVDASSSVNPSLRMYNNTAAPSGTGLTGFTTYGIYTTGSLIQDYMVHNFEAGYLNYPIYINGGGVGSQDLHFYDSILDNCLTSCIYVTGTNAAISSSIQFEHGWAVAKSGVTGNVIDIESSYGISVQNMQLASVSAATLAYVNGSSSVSISNNQFFGAFAVGVQLNNTSNSVVSGNYGDPTGATTILKLTGASYNTIQGNNFKGTATTGLSLDATSSNNTAAKQLNIFATTITTALSDSGTANSLTLPLSAITAGIAPSGSTWDFSAVSQLRLPVASGYSSAADGECGYDSTNKNWHCWVNGADTLMIPLASGFTSGHCAQPTVVGTSWSLVDAGGACGTAGGGSAFSAITSGTNTTATMTCGTGCTINTSGTGQIVATSAPFQYTAMPNPPAVGSFSWVNQGSATTSNNGNAIQMDLPASNVSINVRMLQKSVPGSAPWSAAQCWRVPQQFNGLAAASGIYLTDGTKLEGIEWIAVGNNNWLIRFQHYNTVNDSSTAASKSNRVDFTGGTLSAPIPWLGQTCARLRNDGTNFYADYSTDGKNWINYWSETTNSFLTPTGYGPGGNAWNSSFDTYIDVLGWLETSSGSL